MKVHVVTLVGVVEPMRCYRHPDRETYLSCSECGRPICTECMTPAPVGQRCPEHSGRPQGVARMTTGVRRVSFEGTGAIVTKALIAINVIIYFAELAQGSGVNANSGWIYEKGVLVAKAIDSNGHLVGVAEGDWWRLITAAFLHYGPLHLAMNMLALWWFGAAVEQTIGRGRYIALYLVSGLAGSAGALLLDPTVPTVGASGAIFGILGAAFVLERQHTYVFGGGALTIIALNLVFTFTISSISVGGHLGGLAGGALGMLVLSRFGRGHGVYGRVGVPEVVGLLAIAAFSFVIAYWKVRGYA
jgi:membrane associated rhomboid family serine protease